MLPPTTARHALQFKAALLSTLHGMQDFLLLFLFKAQRQQTSFRSRSS
jgi:hypothetical protein